ncbi:hypothetical protein A2160_04205 [Candidatus Beckwithbacteria bacterium RBG_13_42_9]|uniref:ATP-grasp domain-containing protein n=1 Tax=Candidatus Beckwithbacteria bacterium RBG_13_42_9 TaxID=1797457 RepID=A0A1F5E6K8_9BACT|nr:MAG: hypothetical protein A2160_04205 [Candidatus Beckwithbacteria bacterium RBG_13_42_9]
MFDYPLEKIENTNIYLLLQAADKLGIGWTMLDDDRYEVLLEKNGLAHRFHAHSFKLNSQQSIRLTKHKYQTHRLLETHNVPVLTKIQVKSEKEYLKIYDQIPFPQVIKPAEGEKGRDVYLNIPNQATALKALGFVLRNYFSAIVEPYFLGQDIRILVLNHQAIGLSRRHPPEVVGNGLDTVSQLIKAENQHRRILNQKSGIRMLNRINNFKRIAWYLEKQGLSLSSVIKKGKSLKLQELPNYSAGGWVETLDVSQIHPDFISLSEKMSRLADLTIVGIDWLIKDLPKPPAEANCAVLELNSDPGLRLHDLPNQGRSQHIAEEVLKYIFDLK